MESALAPGALNVFFVASIGRRIHPEMMMMIMMLVLVLVMIMILMMVVVVMMMLALMCMVMKIGCCKVFLGYKMVLNVRISERVNE